MTPNHDEALVPQVPFQILRLPERGSLVCIEDFIGGINPEDATVIQRYARGFDRLGNTVEDPDASHDLIAKVAMQCQ